MPPTGLPCPNPACDHLFDARSVRGASALACPKCGTAYRFRKTPPPPPPRKPATPPPPPPPADHFAFDDGPLVKAPPRRRHRDGGRRLLLGGLLFALLAAGTAAAVWWFDLLPTDWRARRQLPPGWSGDEELRQRLDASQALSRQGPPGYMALIIRDYATRHASQAELMRDARRFLEAHFSQVQFQGPTPEETADGPVLEFPFEGTDRHTKVPSRGRAVARSHRGYAYWMYTWSAEAHHDDLAADFDQLRDSMPLSKDREGWRPSPRPAVLFTSAVLKYQLRFAREVWSNEPVPRDRPAEDRPDFLLRGSGFSLDGKGQKLRLSLDRMATLRSYTWPKVQPGAAVKDGLERLTRLLKHDDEQAAVEEVEKHQRLSRAGALPGHVLQLRIKGDAGDRYGVLALAPQDDGTVAVYAECKWEAREDWREEIMEVVATLRRAP